MSKFESWEDANKFLDEFIKRHGTKDQKAKLKESNDRDFIEARKAYREAHKNDPEPILTEEEKKAHELQMDNCLEEIRKWNQEWARERLSKDFKGFDNPNLIG